MSTQKFTYVRSDKYTRGAIGQRCVISNVNDGTIVPCHYSGKYAHQLGKGAGVKASDLFIADLSHAVHAAMDTYEIGRGFAAGALFLDAIFATQRRRENQGLLFRSSGKGLHEELTVYFEKWTGKLTDEIDEDYEEVFTEMMAFCLKQIEMVESGELVIKGAK